MMKSNKILTVCYVLAYYSPNYPRANTMLGALRRIPNLRVLEARNRSPGLWRYVETLIKLLRVCLEDNPDLFILGFRGLEFFWFVRLLTIGKLLFFDHMMSPYDSLVNETCRLRKTGLLARLLFIYEKAALQAADIVMTDTRLHKEYFEELFRLQPEKVHVVPIGADSMFRAGINDQAQSGNNNSFRVLFYGSFLPLHGVDVILAAAQELKSLPIRFLLIGGSRQDLSEFYRNLHRMKLNKVKHKEWVDYERLPSLIRNADLCLGGPFGNTGQGCRVVTGKTVQCLAMAKPTVIGAIAEDFGFEDRENCLLVTQGNPVELAGAISWAYENRRELPQIGRKGERVFNEHFSSVQIAIALESILQ